MYNPDTQSKKYNLIMLKKVYCGTIKCKCMAWPIIQSTLVAILLPKLMPNLYIFMYLIYTPSMQLIHIVLPVVLKLWFIKETFRQFQICFCWFCRYFNFLFDSPAFSGSVSCINRFFSNRKKSLIILSGPYFDIQLTSGTCNLTST